MTNLTNIPNNLKFEEVLKPLFSTKNFIKYEKAFHEFFHHFDSKKTGDSTSDNLYLFEDARNLFFKNHLKKVTIKKKEKAIHEKAFNEYYKHLFNDTDLLDSYLQFESIETSFLGSSSFEELKDSLELINLFKRAFFARYIQLVHGETVKA